MYTYAYICMQMIYMYTQSCIFKCAYTCTCHVCVSVFLCGCVYMCIWTTAQHRAAYFPFQ